MSACRWRGSIDSRPAGLPASPFGRLRIGDGRATEYKKLRCAARLPPGGVQHRQATALIARRYSLFCLGGVPSATMLANVNPVFDPKPILLEGRHVRLEPLVLHHAEALFTASRDPEIWRWMPIAPFPSVAAVEQWITEALRQQAGGTEIAFATVRQSDGTAVGSTRYLDIRPPHRSLEIGWTWLGREAQRTAVNTGAKYLMLRHAFEAQGAIRVQLKTDERNEQSRRAIMRIGAVFEGILRNYQTRAHDGYVRNTAMYSITAAEWPVVKSGLEKMLRP